MEPHPAISWSVAVMQSVNMYFNSIINVALDELDAYIKENATNTICKILLSSRSIIISEENMYLSLRDRI